MADLPTRPHEVLPCPECGGKRGHVPGCKTAAVLDQDWGRLRVEALRGRVVDSVDYVDRDHVRINFADGVRLDIIHLQLDFSTRGLKLSVTSDEERRSRG